MQKVKVKGHSVQKLELKWSDRRECIITSRATAVGTDGNEWCVCAAGQPPGVSSSSQVVMPSSQEPSSAAGGSSGGGGGPASGGGSGSVEQITVTLLQLQQDMNNVLLRLQSLETLTLQQASTLQR